VAKRRVVIDLRTRPYRASGYVAVKKIVFFLAGRAAGAARCAAYQNCGTQGDERFRKVRAHVSDVTKNVVNVKKPHNG
jgi:hypothetical protein